MEDEAEKEEHLMLKKYVGSAALTLALALVLPRPR